MLDNVFRFRGRLIAEYSSFSRIAFTQAFQGSPVHPPPLWLMSWAPGRGLNSK